MARKKKILKGIDQLHSGGKAQDDTYEPYEPTKLTEFKVDKVTRDELQNLLDESGGMTLEELLIDLVWERNKDKEYLNVYKASRLEPRGKNKDTKQFQVTMDAIEKYQKRLSKLKSLADEKRERRLEYATWKHNEKRTTKNRPVQAILSIRRMEILYAVASLNNNKIESVGLLANNLEVDKQIISTSREIRNLVEGQLNKYDILNLFPDWKKPTSRKTVLKWHKDYEQDLAWLKKEGYLTQKENEYYIDMEAFNETMNEQLLERKQRRVGFFPYSYLALATYYQWFNSDNTKVSEFLLKSLFKPFDTLMKSFYEKKKGN